MSCVNQYDAWAEKWEDYVEKRAEFREAVKQSDESFVKSGDAIGDEKWGTAFSEGVKSARQAWRAEELEDELEELEEQWEEAADELWECICEAWREED